MEDPDAGGSRGVAKLLPKAIRERRRQRKQDSKESFSSSNADSDEPRGRSPHTRSRNLSHPSLRNRSTSMSNKSELVGGGDLSPIMYESEHETTPVRPTVPSSHPSQIGQLTTSSPLIQAEHLADFQNLESMSQESLDSLSRSQTYSVSISSNTNPLSSKGSTGDIKRRLSSAKTGLQPPSSSSARSKSPASRIRDIFSKNKAEPKYPGGVSAHEDSESVEQGSSSSAPDPSSLPEPVLVPEAPEAVDTTEESASIPGSSTNDENVATALRSRGPKSQAKIDTTIRPQTPEPNDTGTPLIVNTPPTPTDSSHKKSSSNPAKPIDLAANPNITVSPSGNMISHRRARSGSANLGPSKLSNVSAAPLTPTLENDPATPGTGFFSSMFSAAQNAANTLSTTVTNSNIGLGINKPKTPVTVTKEIKESDGEITEVEASADTTTETPNMTEPAVKTLGEGELSLSHLGIPETGSSAMVPQNSRLSDAGSETRNRSESAPVGSTVASSSGAAADEEVAQPRSVYESDRSPPASVFEEKSGIPRSGSIRSAIGRRRKRGSTGGTAGTTGTGTTIGAAIAAANASVANPSAGGGAPKLTGFAVASKKRNRDFHALFKSVPDDDYLIEDYSCAIQREILAHGRLYVSEGHLCFSSNIFGWVTTLVMSFDEIVSVEKRSTAILFKNGLEISTLHAKHVFASFTSRDSTYDLIVNIWKLGHPALRSTLNGVSLDGTGGDKTEKIDDGEPPLDHSGSGSEVEDDDDSEEGEDVYDEDEEDEGVPEVTQPTEISPTETDGEKTGTRKISGAVTGVAASEKVKDGAGSPIAGSDFPGPATHGPTECGDTATHFDKMLFDEVVPGPLGKVYTLVFGTASVAFMSKWLTADQKCTDLQMEDKIGLTADNRSRAYTYIKPIFAPIGPKQTKCIVNETIENIDFEKAVNVLVSVQTPDVPSGNIFTIKTKYCFSWAENNATRVQVSCTIEWTGKSWLKGPIEKGSWDGQTQYFKDLFSAVKNTIASKSKTSAGQNGTVGRKKKKGKGEKVKSSQDDTDGNANSAASKKKHWGAFEPLRGIFGPIVDILTPVLTGNVVYGLLVGLLVATWFGFGLNPRQTGGQIGFLGKPDRIVAYEEMWHREENDLWDWLEERVGLHRMNEGAPPMRKRASEPRSLSDKLRDHKMNDREIEEAIRVTGEKLEILKGVLDRKKGHDEAQGAGSSSETPSAAPVS